MLRLLTLTFLTLVLASCGQRDDLKTRSEQAVTADIPSRWPASKFPLKLALDDSFAEDEQESLTSMAEQWSDSAKVNTRYFETTGAKELKQYKNLDDYDDNIMGIYKVTRWDSELPPTALAVTQIFGSHEGSTIKIEHADILINYENFEFSTDGGFGYDLSTVILHELGHFLGLYHQYDRPDESVMYPSIGRFDVMREPFLYDITMLHRKYKGMAQEPSSELYIRRPASNEFSDETIEEKRPVVIRLELNAKGKCSHRINGQIVHEH